MLYLLMHADVLPEDVQRNDGLRRVVRRHKLVSDLALMLGQTTDSQVLYQTICEYISRLMTANAFIVSSFDAANKKIIARFLMTDGVEHDVAGFPVIDLEEEGSGIQSKVIRTGEPLYIPDFAAAMRQTRQVHSFDEEDGLPESEKGDEARDRVSTRSAALVPMRVKGRTVGVIQVQSKVLDDYSREDIELLSALANVSAVALQNCELVAELSHANRQLATTLDHALRAIAMTTEIRDSYTAGHQRRVAALASAIATDMGLDESSVRGIRAAALLHDIGKLAVPAAILAKPARLSDLEYSMVQQHPSIAHRILATIDSPWPLAEAVLQHHERMDGSGYPSGLRGDAILLEARILAVSDVMEAMCSHRPYRPALGRESAIRELFAGRGSCYDSVVVDACIKLFRESDSEFPDPTVPCC